MTSVGTQTFLIEFQSFEKSFCRRKVAVFFKFSLVSTEDHLAAAVVIEADLNHLHQDFQLRLHNGLMTIFHLRLVKNNDSILSRAGEIRRHSGVNPIR